MANDKREQAEKFLADRHIQTPSDISHDELPRLLCEFAATAEAQGWVAIETGLPNKLGPYIFQQIGDDEMFDCLYLGLNTISDKAAYLKSRYVAWMPIPPYQRPSIEGIAKEYYAEGLPEDVSPIYASRRTTKSEGGNK